MKKNKNLGLKSMTFIALALIGLFFVLSANKALPLSRLILVILLAVSTILSFGKTLFVSEDRVHSFLLFLILGFLLFVNIMRPNFYSRFLGIIAGIYALINATIYFIDFRLARRDHLPHVGVKLLAALFHFGFAVPMLLIPIQNSYWVFLISGIYLMVYSLVDLLNIMHDIFGFPGKISIALPAILTVFIPFRLLTHFRKEKDGMKDIYHTPRKECAPLEIYIHTNTKGFDSVGHIDISLDGVIYSYGLHDPREKLVFDSAGSGVLVVADRAPFIAHALTRGTMIFTFKIDISQEEKETIYKRLHTLMEDAVEYHCAAQRAEDDGLPAQEFDYISGVYMATHCKLYKFTRGPFKTYFAPTENCVKFTSYLIQNKEIDLLKMEGIVAPGTYLSYLYGLSGQENSIVKGIDIYYAEGEKDAD